MAYEKEKNPFSCPDDDDDFGFSKPKYVRDTYGASTDPFAFAEGGGNEPLSRYDQLQQSKQNSMNNQLESSRNALASIYDSEAMGIATAEELVRQGEQLDNVDNKLDQINQDMKTSQKHLNGIKSVFGGIKNWWRGDKSQSGQANPERKTQPSAKLTDALDRSLETSGGSGSSSTHPAYRLKSEDGRGFYEEDDLDSQFLSSGPARQDRGRPGAGTRSPQQAQAQAQAPIMKSGFSAHDQQLEENLDLMSDGMSRLKGLALGLGSEIERQNDQIETITTKADRADVKLTDQNRQMRKILR